MKYLLSILLLISIPLFGQVNSPYLHYSFDNTPIDSMLTGKNLTAYGNATYSSNIKQVGTHAGYLDGANDYFKIPTIDLNDTVTIAFWLRTNADVSSLTGLFCSSDTADVADNFNIKALATNQIKVYTGSASAYPVLTLSGGGTWNHLIFTIIRKTSNSVLRAWHNGARCTMVSNDSTLNLTWQTLGRFNIGVDNYINQDLAGQVDDLKIWTGFIPTEEQADSIFDPTGGGTPVVYDPPSISPSYASLGRLRPSYNGLSKYMFYNTPPASSLNYIGIDAVISIEDYDGVCPSGATTLTDADCARNIFATAPLRKIQDTTGYAKVYIDPTTDASGTGTLADPYDSWADITTFNSYTAYLQKKGTTFSQSSKIIISNVNNVVIGAYGTGISPELTTSLNIGQFDILYSNYITIRDIEISNPYHGITTNTSFQIDASIVDVYNCEVHSQHMAFRSGYGSSFRVIGCDIHDILLDPFMCYASSYIEIGFSDIYDFNMAYFSNPDYDYSSGDFIQVMQDINNIYVHHDSIDRSNTGNKSVFQIGAYTTNLTVEFCKIGAPNWNGIAGQNPQIMNAGSANLASNFTFRNNHFRGNMPLNTGRINGLYGFGATDTIVGNIFEGLSTVLWGRAGAVVSNNTFYDNTTAIYYSSAAVYDDIVNNIFWNNGTNLLNVTATTYSGNTTTDPLFIDAVNHDFTLYAASPAVNTGDNLSYHTYDINGSIVPKGAVTDAGAYESDFTTIPNLEERPIFFAEDMEDFAIAAMPLDTLIKYWQPYYTNYSAANQSIIDIGGDHGNVFRTQYLNGECGSGPGLSLVPMLDTTLTEIYVETSVWFSTTWWDNPADAHYSGKPTIGGALGGWWNKSAVQEPYVFDSTANVLTNGWAVHSVWGAPAGSTSAYPNQLIVYYHDLLDGEQTFVMPNTYVNRGYWTTFTTRIKLNTPGKADGIWERYKDGVLIAQDLNLMYRSLQQAQGGYNKIEGIVLRYAVGGTNSYCIDRDIVEYFDDVIAYNYNPTSQYYIPGVAPTGHTIPILRGTVTKHYPDQIIYDRVLTAQSDTISGNPIGATYAPVEQTATIEITGHTGNISMSFLGWYGGYYAEEGSGYEPMWVKIYSGTGVGKTLLYTFDEAHLHAVPTLGATLSIGATSATIEYDTGRDLSIDWLLRYW